MLGIRGAMLLAFFVFAEGRKPFHICVLSVNPNHKLTAMLAAEHITSHNDALIRNTSLPHWIPLNVSVTVHDQGSKQDTFARGTACIDAGADVIIGPAWSS